MIATDRWPEIGAAVTIGNTSGCVAIKLVRFRQRIFLEDNVTGR